MFGSHHNDSDDKKDSSQQEPTAPLPSVFDSGTSAPVPTTAPSAISAEPPAGFNPTTNDPALDDLVKDSGSSESSEPKDSTSSRNEPDNDTDHDELLGLKQEALQKLSPLVGHLDQTPEEKFKTTMMMIQASDDKSKVKEAYEAAQQISDEKARAQALLDVVNEINYFTTKKEG